MNTIEALTYLWAQGLDPEEKAGAGDWGRILATFPLFADVGRRRLRKLVRDARFAEFAPGEPVDARDDALYVVLEGSAKAIGGPASRNMSIGDYFGELSIIGERSPYAAVVATRPLYVMRLPKRSVERLAKQHPALTITLLRDVAGRFMRAERTAYARTVSAASR